MSYHSEALAVTCILGDQIWQGQWMWSRRHVKIRSLKPHSEVVWDTYGHILLIVSSQMCPGSCWRTASRRLNRSLLPERKNALVRVPVASHRSATKTTSCIGLISWSCCLPLVKNDICGLCQWKFSLCLFTYRAEKWAPITSAHLRPMCRSTPMPGVNWPTWTGPGPESRQKCSHLPSKKKKMSDESVKMYLELVADSYVFWYFELQTTPGSPALPHYILIDFHTWKMCLHGTLTFCQGKWRMCWVH